MSNICERLYDGDAESQRKAAEAAGVLTPIVTNILKFLNANPATLFDCCPEDTEGRIRFYAERFESCIICTMAIDEDMRNSARQLSERLMVDKDILPTLRKSLSRTSSRGFLGKFWRIKYVEGHLDSLIRRC